MSIIDRIRGVINMLFEGQAKEAFNVQALPATATDRVVTECFNAYLGKPYWIANGSIKTINFAKAVCSETARLTTLGLGIKFDENTPRSRYLQRKINGIYYMLREWVEYGAAYGTIILKPNGRSIDMFAPSDFRITSSEDGNITGCIFEEVLPDQDGRHYFIRLEHHMRTLSGIDSETNEPVYEYKIVNKCYRGDSARSLGKPVAIEKTPWRALSEEAVVHNCKGNLYAVFKMPHANNADIGSPMSLPLVSDCLEELKDLDIAYSRNSDEIDDSQKIVLLDSNQIMTPPKTKPGNTMAYERAIKAMGLPKYIKAVDPGAKEDVYREILPSIQTSKRLEGINALLSQIGYKIGFANGYFVFNEQSGIQTATGVESNDQRTIQFIKDIRDKLESCMDELIYALNAFADAYDFTAPGVYEVNYDFGDITYNLEEDRARWVSYVINGWVPAWKFFVKFEGMTEDEAKEMIAEAGESQIVQLFATGGNVSDE